jgi:hypothetical protein
VFSSEFKESEQESLSYQIDSLSAQLEDLVMIDFKSDPEL